MAREMVTVRESAPALRGRDASGVAAAMALVPMEMEMATVTAFVMAPGLREMGAARQ